ncbi:DUF4148 domain-containing protein [Caballeronia novacaledonica]|uniref:DUF4148 domain-containing protein n=1 Tax=Caballeronia novacaledonica TaxID=1544861 RepID=A0AA37MSB0_9BURK|nr:DUF4148 domain-containing protein [Caballeronia novacaledonica]GJH25589.1 DUF4148 domain-containing protein [Caballeronia novacaledonica]
MKFRFALYLSVVFSVIPLSATAQSTDTFNRAQARAELAELEQQGYNPGDWIHYPQSLRIAEDRRTQTANQQNPVHASRPE